MDKWSLAYDRFKDEKISIASMKLVNELKLSFGFISSSSSATSGF